MSTLTVGSGQQFSTLSSAIAASQDGDVIQVQAGTYTNDFAEITHKVTIQGVGGMVNLVATQSPPNGKAILTTDTDVTLDHIAFSGATVGDGNGAGVRYQGGNLTINDCYFHDNQDGLLANADPSGSITINNSEFAHNGAGDGQTHNLYVGDVAKLTISNSYFHDAVVGHEIKSRAETTIIENSRIQDQNGSASYNIDLPDGGNATITNNVIEQGAQSQNPSMIHFGGEGGPYANSSLQVSGNTIINDLNRSSAALLYNQTGVSADISNNQIYGLSSNRIALGTAAVSGNTNLATEPALDTSSPWQASSNSGAASTTLASNTASDLASTDQTLVLNLSEDAWQGDAQFLVKVDGNQLGGPQTVTASHTTGNSQAFTFEGNFGPGVHTVQVDFINDAWGGTSDTDRNLYVNSIQYGGQLYPNAQASLFTNGGVQFQVGASQDSVAGSLSGH